MWEASLLLLLQFVRVSVSSQCWQGPTFPSSVVSPVLDDGGGILRVPGVSTLSRCVEAGCDLPWTDLVWVFEGRCYVLSCQQREQCRPKKRPGADSHLAFIRRSPLLLESLSLVRGEPYSDRWGTYKSSEAPGDLQALKDLGLFGSNPDFVDPDLGMLDYSQSNEETETTDHPALKEGEQLSQSEAENETAPTTETTTQRPLETTKATQSSPVSPNPTTDLNQENQNTTPLPSSVTQTTELNENVTTSAPPLSVFLGDPVEQTTVKPNGPLRTQPTTDSVKAPPTSTRPSSTSAVTSEPIPASASCSTPPPPTSSTKPEPESGLNQAPVAVVGPDRVLVLPLTSVLLDGSRSSDDSSIVSYHWNKVSGPGGSTLDGADEALASVSGLRAGRYCFRLTVTDQQGATDSALLTLRIQEALRSPAPVAHAGGSHTLVLPNNSLVLHGSITNTDPGQVHFLWIRDSQSPAAGDVLYGSETQPSLFLSNLVEGTYLFQLRVTDTQSRTASATATIEVQPEPGGGEEVELEMQVYVSQVSVSQRDTVVRQLSALLHVSNSDVQLRGLYGHSRLSTVLRFSVRTPSGPVSGSRVVSLLKNQLLKQKSDFLLFRVLRVDTVLCLLQCSGQGQCNPITKQCLCDPFWTENLIRKYLGDGESNCEWRVLYVILTSFILVILILSVGWTFMCCCRRKRQSKVRRKTKYTILDNVDEQERVELRPKFNIKHRSTEHNSSLMMSESELDSDQDTVFSRDRPVRSRNRLSSQASRNGNAFG